MATFHDSALGSGSGSTTVSTSDALTVTAGDLVWVHVKWETNAATCTVDTGASTPTFSTANAKFGTPFSAQAFYWIATSTGTVTPRAVFSEAADFVTIRAISVTPAGGTSLVLGDTSAAEGNSTSPSSGAADAVAAGASFGGIGIFASVTFTEGSGWTEPAEFDISAAGHAEYQLQSGAGSLTANGTISGANDWIAQLAIFDEEATASLEQEGFRWGVDDGNEASHGWEANQDTSITIADTQSRLLRVLVDTPDNPDALAYTLRYQKNGSGGYAVVPIGSATAPTLSYGATGTLAVSASGGTSVAPTYPTGITTNSCLVLVVGQKPTTANGGTVTTPGDWTLRTSLTGANDGDTGGYTTTLGADTGNCNIFVYTKDTVAGTETGTLSVTVGDNNVCWANIYRIQSSDTCTWSYDSGTGKDTAGGNVSIATSAGVEITAGDHILAGMVIPTDVTTPAQFSAEALAQTSTTFGTVNEIQEPDSGTGNDIGGFMVEAAVSSGGASGAVTLSATAGGTTTNVRGPGFVLRVRASSVNNEVYVDTSANIAAGGEATTARLTAPAGKTTSDFTTGRRWDNENGTDTIDIAADFYTEVEWLVALSSAPSASDFFDFRVYAGSSALNTYTVTPRWTIPSAGGTVIPATAMYYSRLRH